MDTNFKGKRVLITGAATGIGRATALLLGKLGAQVAINYYPSGDQEDRAHEVASQICAELRELECDSLQISADVSEEEEVMKMFQTMRERWGGLDVLINNAGIQRKVPSHELSLSSFMQVIGTNAIGAFLCSREALKIFLEQKIKGVIVNNTSVHQLIPKPQYLSYSMSKGALLNLTRTLALEYAPYGIRVNNVAPGAIMTPINPWSDDEEKKHRISRHIPLGEVGSADEIAEGIVYLAGPQSRYVTGQTLFIDGGLTLYPDFGEDWASS